LVGFLDDGINSGILLSVLPNKCVIATMIDSRPGEYEHIQVPVGASPGQNVQENVFGCGILIGPDNKVTIFFTLNGIFLGEFFSRFLANLIIKDNNKFRGIFIINLIV
jgi:hypothetical protein